MKKFLDENFLLETETAEYLYHQYAASLPIIDYHCHLSPKQISENRNFENITQSWLYGDHYKWRAMRTNGVDERYCSGEATDREKFDKWAETVPYTMRNPLYHWTHLELQRYFEIKELLSPLTADSIYNRTAEMLSHPDYSPVGLIRKMKVEVVCTTDDPIDSLEYHGKVKASHPEISMIPAWRPDKLLNIDNGGPFNDYIRNLESLTAIAITGFDTLLEAMDKRHEFFHSSGCRLSDHGLETFYTEPYTHSELNVILGKARQGLKISNEESLKFKSALLYEMAVMDHKRGWAQQFHIGAMRNNNTRMLKTIGPDGGFDSIGDYRYASAMSAFLDRLNLENKLTKTILYNLNPADNEIIATMAGNFQDGSFPGKIQFGAAWWFLDQKEGIEKQLNALSNLGLLSRFVGMLTDSRSLLSYPRHEYFRRILCNLIGRDVEKGELPDDKAWLGKIIEDVCYRNAKNYFNFKKEKS
ncbi:MAG TPA: glucuronate isomerase [Bacteroidales bacterium]|nr:glucuronate isomerase [Bacteroidales bacterium]